MINLQNPTIPNPLEAIEVDKAVYELQLLLDTKLDWLTYSFGRAYRFLDKNGKKMYFPEVYKGGSNFSYTRVTPDNDKKGTCFFVVGKEEVFDYEPHQKNFLKYNLGILFWVNLKKINEGLLQNEIFTQNLIRDVRRVLTTQGGAKGYSFKLKSVEREFKEIYKEFTLNEEEDYLRAPYSGFRFNIELLVREDCGVVSYNPQEALVNNLSIEEKLVILGSLDFSNPIVFNSLTVEQKIDLGI